MKHTTVSPTEKQKSSHWVKKKKRFQPYMYKKKNLASVKIPTPPPHHISKGPSLKGYNAHQIRLHSKHSIHS